MNALLLYVGGSGELFTITFRLGQFANPLESAMDYVSRLDNQPPMWYVYETGNPKYSHRNGQISNKDQQPKISATL